MNVFYISKYCVSLKVERTTSPLEHFFETKMGKLKATIFSKVLFGKLPGKAEEIPGKCQSEWPAEGLEPASLPSIVTTSANVAPRPREMCVYLLKLRLTCYIKYALPCTEVAPTGSSMWSLSITGIMRQAVAPPRKPITIASHGR